MCYTGFTVYEMPLTLLHTGYFFMIYCHCLTFHNSFSNNSFRNTFRVSNDLDPDQDRSFGGPDLVPNCLQRLSADDKSGH